MACREVMLQNLTSLIAVHFGHHPVHDDKIRYRLEGPLHAFFPIASGKNFITGSVQLEFENCPQTLLIFHDENPGGSRGIIFVLI